MLYVLLFGIWYNACFCYTMLINVYYMFSLYISMCKKFNIVQWEVGNVIGTGLVLDWYRDDCIIRGS